MEQEIDYDKVDFLKNCAPSKTKRFFGNLIDNFIAIILVLSFILPFVFLYPTSELSRLIVENESNWFFEQLVSLSMYQLYFTPFEYFKQGSIGKMILKMKVVNEFSGERPSLKSIILRNLYRLIGLEAFVYLFGGNLWHDRWSDTIVIDLEKYEAASELESLGEKEDESFS